MISRLRAGAPFAVLALLCLPAVHPYLGGDVPRTNDLATHIYRAFELEQLIRAGNLFPRWGPHLVHGYGYPVFNYFAYLSHYVITLVHLITGLGYLWAYRLVVIFATLASAWGTFLLARDLLKSETSGLIAAIGFVYSPYLLMTAHVRGGLPESLALSAFPFALWTWRRAATGQRHFVLWGGVAYAALVFSHNGSAVQVSPLLLAFALWSGRANLRHAIAYTSVAAIVGLLLSAFYWLPALAELSFAQIEEGYASTGIVYQNHFTPLHRLFTYPPVPVDSDMLNPPVSNPVAFLTLGLAIPALIIALRSRSEILADLLCLSALALGCLFLVLPQSRMIWDGVPLLQRTLWPWRFVGPASLFIALVASTLVNCRLQGVGVGRQSFTSYLQLLIGPIILILVMINGLPWLYPPREPIAAPEGIADLAAFELPPWLIGTSSAAEYLPRWVSKQPDSEEQQKMLFINPDPDRLDRSRLPTGVVAQHVTNELLREEYRFESQSDLTLTFRHFFFPGWRATLDDNPTTIKITQPHGLMAIDVPAGEHTLALNFGSSPVRMIAGCLSVTALVFVALQLALVKGEKPQVIRVASNLIPETPRLSMTGWQALGPYCILSSVIIPIFFASAYIDNPLRRHGLTPGNQPLTMQHALGDDLGGELLLHGYSLSSESIAADDDVYLDLYWQARKHLGVVYGFNVRLLDARGRMWNRLEIVRPVSWRFIPGTDFWPPDKYILDNYAVRALSGTPPGDYQLEVVVFHRDTLQSLDVTRVGPLHISTPDRSSYSSSDPLTIMGGETIALRDLIFDRREASPGDAMGVHAVWQSMGTVAPYETHLTLISRVGEKAAIFEFPLSDSYPPSAWQRGDILRDQYIFRIPASLPDGVFEWRLALSTKATGTTEEYSSGITLTVVAPERRFNVPSLSERLNVSLGEQIVLVGYTLGEEIYQPGDSLDVTLIWQSEEHVSIPYHVFVHLVGADGLLAAQSDGEPDEWNRPITGWMPGEFVSDPHTLHLPYDIPSGTYVLRAGIYHPSTGERLPTNLHADGSVLVTVVEVTGK